MKRTNMQSGVLGAAEGVAFRRRIRYAIPCAGTFVAHGGNLAGAPWFFPERGAGLPTTQPSFADTAPACGRER